MSTEWDAATYDRISDPQVRWGAAVLDVSEQMIEQARRNLGHDRRVELVHADLAAGPLPVAGAVDAVFSNATFHWITDHDALFANLAAVMRPGARLVAQCGGEGNIASVVRAVSQAGEEWGQTVRFAGVEETRRRLEALGFRDLRVWLHDEPTRFEPGEPFETFLSTVVLRAHTAAMPVRRRAGFVHDVASRLPEPVIDHVRLNIVARRGP